MTTHLNLQMNILHSAYKTRDFLGANHSAVGDLTVEHNVSSDVLSIKLPFLGILNCPTSMFRV